LARAIMLTVGVKQPPMRGTLACEKAVLLSIVPGTPLGNSQCCASKKELWKMC